jgi:putative endonuclease
MCFCYILFSPTLGKFYTGITQESLEERLNKHNNQTYGNHRFTAKASDWELFFSIRTDSFSHARRMELFIKKMKSKTFIKKLKEDPETLQFLFNKTKKLSN